MNTKEKYCKHKRYLKGLVVLLVFTFMITGCLGEEDYTAYKEAIVKTDGIQRGAESVSVTVNQTFFQNEEDTIDQDILNGFATVKYDLNGQFDKEKEQALYDIYFFFNDLGNDIAYIKQSEEEQYVKLPMFKDYLKINMKMDENHTAIEDDGLEMIIDEIGTEWQNMIQKENVFIGEKITISNEDGEVKATKFTIKPTQEQILLISDKIEESLLTHVDEIVNKVNQMDMSNLFGSGVALNHDKIELDSDQMKEIIENLRSSMTITNFEETAYVDLDGYIIDETITISIEYTQSNATSAAVKSQEIVINTKHWDIDQPQKFEFPVIDDTNSKSIEDFDFSSGFKQ